MTARAGRAPTRSVGAAVSAAGLYAEGLRLLRREQSLRRLAWIPVAIAAGCFALALALVIGFAGELHALTTGWMPELRAETWYAWIWVGPGQLLLFLLSLLLFLALAAVGFATAFLLAGVIAAPFHDALSARVEQVVTGSSSDAGEGGGLRELWREGLRSVVEELRRLVFFVGVQLLILLGGVVLPGGQLLAPVAMALFSIAFLPLEYAGFALDRRKLAFRARRRWVASNLGAMLGFGGLAFVLLLAPGLNFVAMPVFVVAGTLLVLRYPPEGVPQP